MRLLSYEKDGAVVAVTETDLLALMNVPRESLRTPRKPPERRAAQELLTVVEDVLFTIRPHLRSHLPQYSEVRFTTDRFHDDGAPRGSVGTIVEVYRDGYEVEVSNADGRTVFLGAVPDADVEAVQPT
jgi:uncharacterized protein DUF4926